MLELATAIESDVVAAFDGIPGGLYREEDENGAALVPSWWLRVETAGRLSALQDFAPVVLDFWHGSWGDADNLMKRLDAMRDFEVLGVGVYTRQSSGVLQEDVGVFHGFVRWNAVAFGGGDG